MSHTITSGPLWSDPLEQLWHDYQEVECSCNRPDMICFFHANIEVAIRKAMDSGHSGAIAKFVAARQVAYQEGAEDAFASLRAEEEK